MADVETLEELLARHRKEKKDLQGKITQKKKSTTKKTRKGVNDECDRLERDLEERHAAELAAINGGSSAAKIVVTEETLDDQKDREQDGISDAPKDAIPDAELADLSISSNGHSKKPNRQKARLARRAAEQARVVEDAEKEAADMPDHKEREKEVMNKAFKEHGLEEKVVRADGHCLYAAVADQLRSRGEDIKRGPDSAGKDDYRAVRHVAADYMSSNSDDFMPFLEEDLDSYLHKVRDTGEWGGQIELTALSKAYGSKICVIQDGRVTEIGEGPDEKNMWLAYYRHGFGLGEHYNSLRRIEQKAPS